MAHVSNPTVPSCSALLLKPLAALLEARSEVPAWVVSWLVNVDARSRVSALAADTLLEALSRCTGNPLLGLEAANALAPGDLGIFDYILQSAPTVRSALECAARYLPLIHDDAVLTLDQQGSRTLVRLDAPMTPLGPVLEDLMLIGLLLSHTRSWPDAVREHLEVWLTHPVPHDGAPYRPVLGAARVYFQSLHTQFYVPSFLLDEAPRGSDPRLHADVRSCADALLGPLVRSGGLAASVLRCISNHLTHAELSQEWVASGFGLSSRTLCRRLADEGTTYKELLDKARRQTAMQLICERGLSASMVAQRAGFSEEASFYRAFRRWTGLTPLQYVRRQAQDSADPSGRLAARQHAVP